MHSYHIQIQTQYYLENYVLKNYNLKKIPEVYILLQQNLAPTRCKVLSTKVSVLCNSRRLSTVTLVALPLTFGLLFSNTRGVSLSRIAKAMDWGL